MEKETREIWTLAWPVMIGILSHMIFHIVDLFWIGYLGERALAAVAAAGAFAFVLWTGTGIMRTGGLAVLSQAFGRKDMARLRGASADCLVLAAGIGVTVSVPAWVYLDSVIGFFKLDATTHAFAMQYGRIALIGVPLWYVSEASVAYFIGLGRTRVPMVVGLACNGLNLILDPLLILGWGPVPAMGIEGAAIATLASGVLMCLVTVVWHLRSCGLTVDDFGLRWKAMGGLVSIGLPATVRDFSRPLVGMLMYRILSGYGAAVVAAFGISLKFIGLMIVYIAGLHVALTTLTGRTIGEGKVDRVEDILGRGLRIGLSLHLGIAVALTFLAGPALGLFDGTGRVVEAGIPIVRILAWTVTAVLFTRVMGSAFAGSGDTSPLMIASLSTHWLVQLPLAYLLSGWMASPMGVWIAIVMARLGEMTILWTYYRTGRWKRVRAS